MVLASGGFGCDGEVVGKVLGGEREGPEYLGKVGVIDFV